ncbi:MAG: hypothetical protein ACK4V6_13395 [Microthrixaceae bacterium]
MTTPSRTAEPSERPSERTPADDRGTVPSREDRLVGGRLGWSNQMLGNWLTERRNAGETPADIAADLVRSGWDADTSARVALRSLRSADRQTLTYAALCLSAGFAALGIASSGHLILAGNPEPMTLTTMLTLALVATPIAITAAVGARRAERRSTFVMWSPSRRGWFGALALCTGLVGIVRLLGYVFGAIATLTGAVDDDFSVVAAVQVLVTLSVALPLFVVSFREWRRSNLVIAALSDDRTDDPHPDGATPHGSATPPTAGPAFVPRTPRT